MAQDIRDLLKRDTSLEHTSMPKGHEARFLERLNKELPEKKTTSSIPFMKIAASFIILLGLGFATYQFFKPDPGIKGDVVVDNQNTDTVTEESEKSLGDISPELKKVEDYYLASINLELSRVEYTDGTKELLDGYFERLEELTKEYKRLTKELNTSGPNELMVNALIDNLKLRLNLLYKLRSKLNELQTAESGDAEKQTT